MIECVACLPRGSVVALPWHVRWTILRVVGCFAEQRIGENSETEHSTTASVLCTVSRTSEFRAAVVARSLRGTAATTCGNGRSDRCHSLHGGFTAQRTLLSTAQLVRYPVRKPL